MQENLKTSNNIWNITIFFVTLHQRKTQEFHPSFLCEIPKSQRNSTLYQLYLKSISTLYQLYTNTMVPHGFL